MIKRIFLAGNPNVGKSVVFSRLTGVNVIVSNFPGTTVEFKKGFLKLDEGICEVVDLTGLYALDAVSDAERVTSSLLKAQNKDEIAVINVVDATNLERNLFLTLQLLEEGFPVLICLNMCDDTKHRGIYIDTEKLQAILKTPVISTCAVTGMGIRYLISRLNEVKSIPQRDISHQARWLEIGRIVESVQQLTHRHHTLREMLEDA